jgi:hypothetical protein
MKNTLEKLSATSSSPSDRWGWFLEKIQSIKDILDEIENAPAIAKSK